MGIRWPVPLLLVSRLLLLLCYSRPAVVSVLLLLYKCYSTSARRAANGCAHPSASQSARQQLHQHRQYLVVLYRAVADIVKTEVVQLPALHDHVVILTVIPTGTGASPKIILLYTVSLLRMEPVGGQINNYFEVYKQRLHPGIISARPDVRGAVAALQANDTFNVS